MAYVALYRKWRPQGFDSLVGQEAVRTALTNALETGRIAHAYLFAGPRGEGVNTKAKIIVQGGLGGKGAPGPPRQKINNRGGVKPPLPCKECLL